MVRALGPYTFLTRYPSYRFSRSISSTLPCSTATFDDTGNLNSGFADKLVTEKDSGNSTTGRAVQIRYSSPIQGQNNHPKDFQIRPDVWVRHVVSPALPGRSNPQDKTSIRIRYIKSLARPGRKNSQGLQDQSNVRIHYVEGSNLARGRKNNYHEDPKTRQNYRFRYIKSHGRIDDITENPKAGQRIRLYYSDRRHTLSQQQTSVRSGSEPPNSPSLIRKVRPVAHPQRHESDMAISLKRWELLFLESNAIPVLGQHTSSNSSHETDKTPVGTGPPTSYISNDNVWKGMAHSRPTPLSQLRRNPVASRPQSSFALRAFSSSITNSSVLESYRIHLPEAELPLSLKDQAASQAEIYDIRSHLRLWNPPGSDKKGQFSETKNPREQRIYNQLRPSTDGMVLDSQQLDCDSAQTIYEKGELVDFGDSRTFFLRGDLVELRSTVSSRIELGIFVRTVGRQSQFYTMTGKWAHQATVLPIFFVPGFVQPHELDSLLPFLPDSDIPEALQGIPQCFANAAPRNLGAFLVKKMLQFWTESNAIYRLAASKIDNAHQLIANPNTLRQASLTFLADKLLPVSLKKNGSYPPAALYALHRSLSREGSGFRPQNLTTFRTWGKFEISSMDEIDTINTVCEEVRMYQESLAKGVDSRGSTDALSGSTDFQMFIAKAQELIDESRQTRKVTSHGTVGPVESGVYNVDFPKVITKARFEQSDDRFLRFMESWCGLKTIRRHSYLHGVASTILRATGRYGGLELGKDTGWIFLQEIGAIAPWENPVAFDIRLPMVGRILTSEKLHDDWDQSPVYSLRPDALEHLRKDWGQLPVYCIDGVDAEEIDDGVSIEPTTSPDEYWVHIHTADPASRIAPQGQMANRALSMVESIYLPERSISMLPRRIVREHLSLAAHRNCLTFSARVNLEGEILEYNITPAVVRNVNFLTPKLVSEVVGEATSEEMVITVGVKPEAEASTLPRRPILRRHEVTAEHEHNLKLLRAVSIARSVKAASRGAINFSDSRFSVHVSSSQHSFNRKCDPSRSVQYNVDPIIQLTASKWDMVSAAPRFDPVRELMLLGGEVAARWCHERGIPIIYRVTQFNPEQPDPTEFLRSKLLQYKGPPRPLDEENSSEKGDVSSAAETAEPSSRSREDPGRGLLSRVSELSIPSELKLEYIRRLGNILPSSTAGPHVALGLKMFTKTTSPLRRCADLVTHWQIEAALLEEARTSRSLVGSTSEDYLPFPKSEIDKLLPHVDARERILKTASLAAQRVWAIQLLVRAWEFKQAPLPPTFEFVVRQVSPVTGFAVGQVVQLGGMHASMTPPEDMAVDDVKPQDVFEVEITDLNVYTQQINVRGRKRIRAAETATS